jgi:hypothetical protein
MAYVTNRREIETKVKASMAQFKRNLSQGIMITCLAIDETLKSHTPVWSGKAVRNYIWSAGAPSMEVFAAIENGPTGPTNSMALGTEPRRAVNEEAAFESFLTLPFDNPFQCFYLTNHAEDIAGLELGQLPTSDRSRSPNGMFLLTQGYISALVNSKGFVR